MCAEQGSRDSSVWRAVSLCCRWSASSLPQQTAGSRAGSCLTSLAHLEGSWEEGMGTQKAPLILCKRAQGRRTGKRSRQGLYLRTAPQRISRISASVLTQGEPVGPLENISSQFPQCCRPRPRGYPGTAPLIHTPAP